MSTLSKVFLALIFLTAIFYFHAAVRTLATLNAWGSVVTERERDIDAAKQTLEKAVEGDIDTGQKSLVDLEIDLHKVQADRGRAWYGTTPTATTQDAATGLVTATVTVLDYDVEPGAQPSPDIDHQLRPPMIVHLFDERSLAEGGTYLGEFVVTAVQESSVTVASTMPRTPEDFQRIDAARAGTWALYDIVPGDDHMLWATLSEEERRAYMPALPVQREGEHPDDFASRTADYEEALDHFLRDGRETKPGDLEEHIVTVVTFIKKDQAAQALMTSLGLPVELLQTGEQYTFERTIGQQLIDAQVAQLVENGVRYRRPLFDYGLLFREYARQRPILLDRVDAAQKLLAAQDAAAKDAVMDVQFAEAEIASLTAEKADLDGEVALAVARRDKLDAELKQTQARIAELLADNQRLAADLAALQEAAAQRAEEAVQTSQVGVE